MWIVYVLLSKKVRKTYVGSTNNLERRLYEHNNGKSRFTHSYIPWEVIYTEEYLTKQEARQRERFLKTHTGRRFLKETLDEKINNIWIGSSTG